MSRIGSTRKTLGALAAALALAGATAAAEKAEAPDAKPAEESGAKPGDAPDAARKGRSGLTVYVPPSRGAAGVRSGGGTRLGAGTRGIVPPRLAVLAPDHVGVTTRAQPALAWYLSDDTELPVELTVIPEMAVEPLVVKRLAGPLRAGIHLVDLAELGVRLEEGVTYDWFVSLVVDPEARDSDVVAGGAIERRSTPAELGAALSGSEPTYRALARHGVWYDAIADLSAAIASAPGDEYLRAERAGLLEQVGVAAAAAYERGQGSAP